MNKVLSLQHKECVTTFCQAKEKGSVSILDKPYWEALMATMLTAQNSGDSIGSIEERFKEQVINAVKDLECQLDKLNSQPFIVEKSPLEDLSFSIIGAGLAGLCLAVKLNTTFPDYPITVFEKRDANTRFQTISFRLIEACKWVFSETTLLEDPHGTSLFEQHGAWKEPAPHDGDERMRAPILAYQNALKNYLVSKGVLFKTEEVDIFQENNDPSHLRFICTGLMPGMDKSSAPFQLEKQVSTIMHAWEFQESSQPVHGLPFRHDPQKKVTVMTGGNTKEALQHFFYGFNAMARKHSTQVHLPSGYTYQEFDNDLVKWQSKEHVQVSVNSSYVTSDADVERKGFSGHYWSTFKMIPYIGMDPFFLSGPLGNTLASGDSVNSRHPYKGNGSLAIFQGIKHIIDYIENYKSQSQNNEQLRQKLRLEHQIDNIPRMYESLIEYLKFRSII